MQSVADAKQTARQAAKEAEEAVEVARLATQTALDAKDNAEKMAKAADDAAEAARVAARTAVEAKEAAARTAQAAPQAAEVASAASQTAAGAEQKAEALEQVVASACLANTPTAWSDALRRTAVATETKPSLDEQPVAEASRRARIGEFALSSSLDAVALLSTCLRSSAPPCSSLRHPMERPDRIRFQVGVARRTYGRDCRLRFSNKSGTKPL